MAFCQIVLSNTIINGIANDKSGSVQKHKADHPKDPVPIPLDDPNPQVRDSCIIVEYSLNRIS